MTIPNITSEIDIHQLVNRYGAKVSALAHRMIIDKDKAQDAAQEVWYQVLKSIDSFAGRSDISTWLYTIARRTILRYSADERIISYRQYNEHFNREPIDYTGDESNRKQWAKEQCDYCLTAFCHCLTNSARLIFVFRTLIGLDYNQVAEIMEMNDEAVRKVSSRSVTKVKHFMKRDCFLYNENGRCRCRMRKHIVDVDLKREYKVLSDAVDMIKIFQESEKVLPRKNYWLEFISG
ncbi:MAG: sigma-70 family RNA polymerase sigma factor [Bacteroidales bacterium]|jgi:RNA polymerase sigma-70 factor (ECF subfamily)|nr:sigma-70 family RNA polymerase sigma factor [Bacteroidales bacterium]